MATDLTKFWTRSRADELAVEAGCYFDPNSAAPKRVCNFLQQLCRQSKGRWAGKPIVLMPWQRDEIVYPMFGWKRPDGSRRFRHASIWIPKKNGKSTLASAIGLYMLLGDREQGAEVYSAAADRQQAGIVHGEAVKMVKASPELYSRLRINHTSWTITDEATQSFYRAISSEANTKEGLNAHALLLDELHAWYGSALWQTLKYAGLTRRQPLTFVISTAGDDVDSVGYSEYEKAKHILDGTVHDDRFFAYVREAREEDDFADPETWRKANPSLGVTFSEEDFARDLDEAMRTPGDLAAFKRYRLNIWQTDTSPWMHISKWHACRRDFTEADLYGMPCAAGLDLSRTDDMCALVLVFPQHTEDEKPRYRILPYFWLPEAKIRDRNTPEEWRQWVRDGWLGEMPGETTDYTFILAKFKELLDAGFDIRQVVYDPCYANETTQRIEEDMGVGRELFRQGMLSFAGPTAEWEGCVLDQRLEHNGHPIMTWQMSHTNIKTDVNANKRPIKPAPNSQKKIDGVVAGIMGLAWCMANANQMAPQDYKVQWL